MPSSPSSAGCLDGSVVKNPPAYTGDAFLSGDPMDRRAWWVTVHGVSKSQRQWSDWALVHALISPLSFMPLASQASFFKSWGEMGITHSIWLSPGKVGTHLSCYCHDLATHRRAGRKQEFCFGMRKLKGNRLLYFCLGLRWISCCSKKSRHFPESWETAQCEGMYCIEGEVHGVSNPNAFGGKGNKWQVRGTQSEVWRKMARDCQGWRSFGENETVGHLWIEWPIYKGHTSLV